MSFDVKRLYELLPALYRIRDTELGKKIHQAQTGTLPNDPEAIHGPIKAILSLIADEVAGIEENLAQLYDDQFIETCAEWVIPYIGQLVGTRGLIQIPNEAFSQRAEVANTIPNRRRKGTASVIEQLARDITGWDANVVEYFQLLATTQYLNHLRPQHLATADLRNWRKLNYLNTPFETIARTADVGRIATHNGKYNIKNIGIFLWRIKDYGLNPAPAYQVDDLRYTFDALGKDTPLYHHPIPEDTISQLSQALNVAHPIGRRILKEDLDLYYGKSKSLLIYINGIALTPENAADFFNPVPNSPISLKDIICVCNLSDIFDDANTPLGWANMPDDKIAIDPVLGRIALPPNLAIPIADINLQVMYHYGFSADIGGGSYERTSTFLPTEPDFVEVKKGGTSIQDALNQLAATGGTIEISDNEYYIENLNIVIATDQTIEIRAAASCRPILVLENYIQLDTQANSQLVLNGLLISGGGIEITANNQLQELKIIHCTLLPSPSPAIESVAAQALMARLIVASMTPTIVIEKSIVGPLRVIEGTEVHISDSIVDAQKTGIAYSAPLETSAGSRLHIQNSTLIGTVQTTLMEMASNSIFIAEGTAPLIKAARLQEGCVRFSYFPEGSQLPRPYRCQPQLSGDPIAVQVLFNSLTYGDPAYAQLHDYCPIAITTGADDGAEMGVFHQLYQAQRLANFKTRLNEYLRFGLEAGVFYAS